MFIATIIGIPADFAWFIASTVCGIIPSFAATTSIAISVICAPLALIAVNASCPGVSKNVIFLPLISTMYAPIACVIPPASPSITFVLRIVSSKDVFPWSTCPITTTTGGLSSNSSSLSSESSNNMSSSVTVCFFLAVIPNSPATKNAVSKSISLFIVAIIPYPNNFLITSAVVFFISAAKSFTVMLSGISMSVNLKIFCLLRSSFPFVAFFLPFLPRSVVKS